LFDCCQAEFYLVGVDLTEELNLDVLGVRVFLEGLDPLVFYLVEVVLVSSALEMSIFMVFPSLARSWALWLTSKSDRSSVLAEC
jgi:hypothetical protein